MDSAAATIDMLPEIAEAVGDKITVLLDSGIRRGSDIVKAVALGAKCVLTGRATLYGTAVGGEKGASKAINFIQTEMDKTMAYTGCNRVDEITTDIFFGDRETNRMAVQLMAALDDCYNVFDLREAAQRRLPKGVFEFVDRATEDHIAVRDNRTAFEEIKLRHRALVDVSGRSTATTLFGKPMALPMAIAPTGAAGLCWYRGELALAKAAAKAGIPLTLSTASMTAMETIAKEAGGRLWFQLYVWKRRDLSHQIIERAKDAGYEALIVTVNSAVSGNREYNARNGFALPFNPSRKFLLDVATHPAWTLGRDGQIPHHHRHAETRELPGGISGPHHQRRRRAAHGDGGRFTQLGRHREIPRHVAGHPDAERRQSDR